MRKKVGEFTETSEQMFVNNAIEDLFDSGESDLLDDYQDEADDDPSNVLEPEIDEDFDDPIESAEDDDADNDDKDVSDVVDNTSVVTEDSVESFDDYSNTALLALALKDVDSELLELPEVSKDLKAEDLIEGIKKSVTKKVEEQKEILTNQYAEIADYINAVMNGADEDTIQTAAYLKNIADVVLTGEEEQEDLEFIVKSGLKLKNTAPDVIDDIIENYKEKGLLAEKAEESIALHKQQEMIVLQSAQREAEARKQQWLQEKQKTDAQIKAIISKGTAKGLALEKKALEDAIFKPTELVEGVDNQGRKVTYKVPLVEKRYQEFSKDLEQQIAFMQLLANGFDFTSVVNKAKTKVNSELTNLLNSRNTSTSNKRKNYFED
jgi:hypothetical protein